MATRGEIRCLGVAIDPKGLAFAVVDYLERKVVTWGHQPLPAGAWLDEFRPNSEVLAPFINSITANFESVRSVHLVVPELYIKHDVMDMHGLSNSEIHEILFNKVNDSGSAQASPTTSLVYFTPRSDAGANPFQKIPVYYLHTPDDLFQLWLKTFDQTSLRFGGLSGAEQIASMMFVLDSERSPDVYFLSLYLGIQQCEILLNAGHQIIELHHIQQTEAGLRQWDEEQHQFIARVKNIFLSIQGKYAGGIAVDHVNVYSWGGQFRGLAEKARDACKAATVNVMEPRNLFSALPSDDTPDPLVWQAAVAALAEGARNQKDIQQATIFDSILRRKYFFQPQAVGIFAVALLVVLLINLSAYSFFQWNDSSWNEKNLALTRQNSALRVLPDSTEKKLALYQGIDKPTPELDSLLALLQNVMPDDAWVTAFKFVPPSTVELYGKSILEASVQMFVDKLNQYLTGVELRSVENISTKSSFQTRFVVIITI